MAIVFVVGAGPAGLFAAQKIALAGHEVVIFNRDIKPGGLAEYGIYPFKEKMKTGLRGQFAKVLAMPRVHYFGHVPVGRESAVSIEVLRELSPAAMIFAVGAQAAKEMGLPGENARGVYAAKDFVYHYNRLPPFASRDFSTGKRIAIIGMGNVMVDVARWLLRDDPDHRAEEVIVVARRGPIEAKFDEKEFAHIQMHLDRAAFGNELKRVRQRLADAGQDIAKVPEETFPCLIKYAHQDTAAAHLKFRFLSTPVAVAAGPDGRIEKLVIADNLLVNHQGRIAAQVTGRTAELDVDTLIFAIGDQHDPSWGLPCGRDGYVTNWNGVDPAARYEVFDPASATVLEGSYVVGWARKASDGLVGIARHDGETGASHVLKYIESQHRRSAGASEIVRALEKKSVRLVLKSDLPWLTLAEERACRSGCASMFLEDAAILSAIEREKSICAEVLDPVALGRYRIPEPAKGE